VRMTRARDVEGNLDAVLDSCQNEPMVIYREGKPCAVLVGIQGYDAEDLRLAKSPAFWRMIQQRRAEGKSIPLAEVESRLVGQRRRRGAAKKQRHRS
jgi:antitoxin (DNA-binding transcriptional repressor) of toxin-antitoxin stability system